MKTNFTILFLLITSHLLYSQIDADSVMGIPTAATNAEMNAVTTAATGSMLYNLEELKVFVYNGTAWVAAVDNASWLTAGNTGLTGTVFLGHTDDVAMEIRSNNLPLLQFGRRQTLGLTQGFPDYTNNDQPLVYVNGDGSVSALQFSAAGASFYKPMFFTTANGSFRLKGSSGRTDLFEIGSAGPNNDGKLEFIIGDDGREPIVFKRYDYRRGQFHRELFRVQGSNNTADATTRFGINLNTQEVPVDADYDDPSTGFNIANSTLQVEGSVSTSILNTTADLTLTENHHTVIIAGNHNITLPNANTCEGRLYIIKNTTNNIRTISNYLDLTNTSQTAISANSVLWIKSNGTDWHQINTSVTYEKIVIWAEEAAELSDNNNEWSFANGATGRIGIPLVEDWEIYAVSFNADTNGATDTVEMAVRNTTTDTTLLTFTASGAANNMVYTEVLATPVAVAAGVTIGFRTINETGDVRNARVAVFLRRLP